MPLFQAGEPPPRRNTSGSASIFTSWHAFCLFAVGGCLYVEPVWRPGENTPVAFIEPTAAMDGDAFPVQVGPAGATINVITFDDDGDQIRFIWSVPAGVAWISERVVESDTLTHGRLTLEPEGVFAGQVIELFAIEDRVDGVTRNLLFDLEVP